MKLMALIESMGRKMMMICMDMKVEEIVNKIRGLLRAVRLLVLMLLRLRRQSPPPQPCSTHLINKCSTFDTPILPPQMKMASIPTVRIGTAATASKALVLRDAALITQLEDGSER